MNTNERILHVCHEIEYLESILPIAKENAQRGIISFNRYRDLKEELDECYSILDDLDPCEMWKGGF